VKRTYSQPEIEVLKLSGCSDAEIEELQGGDASFKLIRTADCTLKKYREQFNAAMSRGEAMQTFIAIQTFRLFYVSDFGPKMNRLLAAIEVLKDKGILTESDIDAKLQVLVERFKKEHGENDPVPGEGGQ